MKYFTIKELTASSTAEAHGIDNTPSATAVAALTDLVISLLDPLRERWGKPLQVNSGYRSPALNKKVGGAATSQHVKGEAADITAGMPDDNKRLFELVKSSGLDFDQLIDERNYSWIHLSYKKWGNRKQILHL